MPKIYFFLIGCFLLCLNTSAQSLRDINYRYLYDQNEALQFQIKPVRDSAGWKVFSKLTLPDTTYTTTDVKIEWFTRENLAVKEDESLSANPTQAIVSKAQAIYEIQIPSFPLPRILVAKVTHTPLKKAWYFFTILTANYPVKQYAKVNDLTIISPYTTVGGNINVDNQTKAVVSYYNDNFPAALPPFAESQGRVSRGMKTDSTFFIQPGESFKVNARGLYLIQNDTSSVEGFSFRAEEDYPKLGRIASLAGPLVYVSTKQENDRLLVANNDKKAFDRVILSITNDTERARKFMRNYFRRVELANTYFTSYKEGWKTDRGMIFIIFGLPDEVVKLEDKEIWTYKSDEIRASFTFNKSSSIFDPENLVLIRDKKYHQTWYETIDQWRNARY